MKKLYSFLLFLSAISTISHAQKDCCTAIRLIDNSPFTIPFTAGSGKPDDVSCSCLSGEPNSYWFVFDAYTTGEFEMMITPLGKADFNFSLWEGRCPCEQQSVLIECDSAGPADPINGPFVPTGISKNPMAIFGVPGLTEFQIPSVTIFEGRTYYLLVSNVTDGTGFSMQFAGDAVIGEHVLPPGPAPISGLTTACPGSYVEYSVPGNLSFSGYSWEVTPGGGPVSSSEPNKTIYWGEPGTYELCVTSYMGSCYPSAPSCVTVEVSEIVTFVDDVICFPGVYYAPDGSEIYQPGVHTIVLESYLGCDSTIVLNLTPALTDFIVLVETVCQGECYDFEGETICEPGAYEKVFTNQYGCDSTRLLTLVVFPNESVIEGADTLDCNKTSLVLDGSGSVGGPNMSFIWRRGNQVVGTDTFLTVTMGGVYSLTTRSIIAPGDTCESVETVNIIADFAVPQNVTAIAGALDCNTSSTTLMGNSSTPNVTYGWTGPGGFTSNLQNPTVNVAGNYTLTVTGPNGCTKTATVTVVNSPPPVASAVGGTIDCNHSTVTLLGNSNPPGASYSWQGPGGEIYLEQNPTVNMVGNYILTITDNAGCTATATAVVQDGTTPPNASASTNGNLNCQASSVVLSGTGSSTGAAFSYLWTTQNGNIVSGSTTLTPTVNAVGTYILTVTNNNSGCTNTAQTEVVLSPAVTGSIASQTNVLCFGEDTGSATAAGGGGNGTYTYNWSNGDTGASISDVGAGNYSVTITDGEGCTATTNVTITQPALLEANASATGQSNPGVDDGTATANPVGGTGAYSYAWSNGENTQTITGLAPGVYTVTVTDENGCESVQSVNVAESNCNIKADIDRVNVTCNGAANGSAIINLDNAAPPFNYIWSNGDTTQMISNLSGGNYTVTATDQFGCEVVASIFIIEPAVLNANATADDESAPGAGDGSATANPTGGSAPYTYEWNTGDTTATITNLSPGTYTVMVNDTNDCQVTQTVEVVTEGCFISATVSGTDISCTGAADGQATAVLMGGLAPFTYEWSTGDTTATVSGLAPGIYSVTVFDMIGCPAEAEVTIGEPDPLETAVGSLTLADCMATNGEATIIAAGGTPGYTFEWSNSATGASVGNLAPTNYTVTVTDANGCESIISLTIGVDDPIPPVIATQDITVGLGQDGTVVISPEEVDNGSMDDCEIVSMVLDVTSFDCNSLGDHEVLLTITDAGGNVVSETATVTVVDNTPPNLVLENITITLDENGVATIDPSMFDNGSSDNCGDLVWTIVPTELNCDNIGDTDVELTATDASGNTTTTTATATVVDDTPPSLTCPEGLFLPYCDPVGVFDVTAFDNCDDNITITQTSGPASGSTFPTGNTTITFEATNSSGVTATCSFMITVPSVMGLTTTSEDASCFDEEDGSALVTATGGISPYTYLWSNGQNTAAVDGLGAGDYTVTVTDDAGCEEVQTITIGEPANLVIDLIDITNASGSQANGSIDVSVSGGVPPFSFEWKDLNGNVLATTEDIGGLAAGTYQLFVTDANGCESLSAFTIQMTDGTEEEMFENNIVLYPNPTNGEVIVEVNDPSFSGMEITVYDVVGKTVANYSAATLKHRLDFAAQPAGIYLLKIMVGEKVATKRLVVSR